MATRVEVVRGAFHRQGETHTGTLIQATFSGATLTSVLVDTAAGHRTIVVGERDTVRMYPYVERN